MPWRGGGGCVLDMVEIPEQLHLERIAYCLGDPVFSRSVLHGYANHDGLTVFWRDMKDHFTIGIRTPVHLDTPFIGSVCKHSSRCQQIQGDQEKEPRQMASGNQYARATSFQTGQAL